MQNGLCTYQVFRLVIFVSLWTLSLSGFSQRCDVNGIVFNQQAGFGNNSKILIGGYGQNDGAINFNCYSDSTTYGVSRSFNRPVGVLPPSGSPVPSWSARIFQDIPAGVLRIQSSPVDYTCYNTVSWNKGISVNASGGVGIGTDVTFGALLAVNGMIYSKADVEVNPTHAWPDYVFTPEYPLPTVFEYEQQVKQLGYIPQLGSAQDIETNGLRLGEMQTKQTEVMEIMLLHQFELAHKIDSLDSVNVVLLKRITNFDKELKLFAENLKLLQQAPNSQPDKENNNCIPTFVTPVVNGVKEKVD